METEGGGWTAIQKRVSGAVSFNKVWAEYKRGFGNPNDSYWIGNDVIHQLTKGRNSSLYVSITLKNGKTLYSRYQQFSVSSEEDNYKLYLGGPATGTLDYSLVESLYIINNMSGMSFTTLDRDNDRDSGGNCAVQYEGGWWFNSCYYAYINGPLSSSYNLWRPAVPGAGEIKETVMMIKPN